MCRHTHTHCGINTHTFNFCMQHAHVFVLVFAYTFQLFALYEGLSKPYNPYIPSLRTSNWICRIFRSMFPADCTTARSAPSASTFRNQTSCPPSQSLMTCFSEMHGTVRTSAEVAQSALKFGTAGCSASMSG